MLDRRGNKVGQIDPATNEVVAEWDLTQTLGGRSFSAWDLDAASDSLWVTVPNKRNFFELDPDTGEVLSTVRTRGHSSDIFVAGGSLWFADEGRRGVDLVRVRPSSGKTIKRFRFGPMNSHVLDVVSFRGSIWVTRSYARHVAGSGRNTTFFLTTHLWRIDPRSNRVVSRLPLGSTYTRGPVNPVIGDAEVGAEGVWMSRIHERRVVLINPPNGRLTREFVIGDFELPWEFELAKGHLWIGELNGPRVMWLDPTTKERELVDVGGETSSIGSGFGSAWVPLAGSSPDGGEVVRLTHQ